MKNYFVDAYVKSKSPNFINNYLMMVEKYVPYFKDGKLNYKEKTIKPICSLKTHIFISNGR